MSAGRHRVAGAKPLYLATVVDPCSRPLTSGAIADVTSDHLGAWANRRKRRSTAAPVGGLRFAFYGRVSTEDHQDPETSKAWQLQRARATIAGAERIVAEFFDVGYTRALPWQRRPQAPRLTAALADPDRGFDAIVVGAHERAFYGNQYTLKASLFAHHGIQL
jgi:site-specific DNA recombinase